MAFDSTIRKNLDITLNKAAESLDTVAQEVEKQGKLQPIIIEFYTAQGVLTMMQVSGGAALIEEIKFIFNALDDEALAFEEKLITQLKKAITQLKNYLGFLESGNQDVPVVLLPMINALRELRQQNPLTPGNFFNPDLKGNLPPELKKEITKKDLTPEERALASKLRGLYQANLLQWHKDPSKKDALIQLYRVLDKAFSISHHIEPARLFWLGSALIESYVNHPEHPDTFKRALVQIEAKLKQFAESSIEAFNSDHTTNALTKNLLYQIATAHAAGKRSIIAKKFYVLQRFIPDHNTLTHIKSILEGVDKKKLADSSKNIQNDLDELRDVLDDYVLEDEFDEETLTTIVKKLKVLLEQIATYPIGKQIAILKKHLEYLNQAIVKKSQPKQDVFLNLAQILVQTGQAVKEVTKGNVPSEEDNAFEQTIIKVVTEASDDLSHIKDNFIVYSANPSDKKPLNIIPEKLNNLKGAMFVHPLNQITPVLNKLASYIAEELIRNDNKPHSQVLQILADLITSIEFFFENIQKGQDYSRVLGQMQTYLKDLEEAKHLPEEASSLSVGSITAIGNATEEQKAAAANTMTTSSVPQEVEEEIPFLEGETDPELLEIFIEESEEEQARINEHLNIWRKNLTDVESLTVIRRSFHTLKGSGRMIGAKLIGEFAWAFESLLNRILDNSVSPSEDIANAIESSTRALTQLVNQLKGGPAPSTNIMDLMALAHRLSKGE